MRCPPEARDLSTEAGVGRDATKGHKKVTSAAHVAGKSKGDPALAASEIDKLYPSHSGASDEGGNEEPTGSGTGNG